ncbi:MAG: DEAD/DEAH box helicase [Schleiferiaceae bacterium]|nr:DEAD/DEAH box helicase [Schleiferiaceae bacterium]
MNTFKELGVDQNIVKGLSEMGIVEPTEIQTQVIPILLQSKADLVGQAQTGTGKTAAFGIPLLEQIDPSRKVVQGLILSPTRELGQQIKKQLFKITKYTDKIFVEAVYGGAKIDEQIKALQRPTHIIVATPGRLIDLVKRDAVNLRNVRTIVLDEADEMLSMGFKKELDKILQFVSAAENKWLFSATMPHGIKQIINQHLRPDAVRVQISGTNTVNKKIEHKFLRCEDADKLNVLIQFLKTQKGERGMIFSKTKAATQKLAQQLEARNISVSALHGDMLQKDRDKAMRAFKNKSSQILVSTDVSARGIDVAGLAYVVHYQMPDKTEYYTHRSGRTARAGNEGLSLCLVNSKELKSVRFFEKTLKISFSEVRALK